MKSGMLISAAFHCALMVWALLLSNRPAPLEAHANQGAEVDIAFQTEEDLKQEEEQEKEQEKEEVQDQDKQVKEEVQDRDKQEKEEVQDRDKQETEQSKPAEAAMDTSESGAEKNENTQNETNTDQESEIAGIDAPDAGRKPQTDKRQPKETQERPERAATQTGNSGGSASPSQPADGTSNSGTMPAPGEISRSSARPAAAEELAATKPGENPEDRQNSEVFAGLGERMAATSPDQPDTDRPIGREEYEALKKRINECWQIPELVDTQNLQIVLDMQMSGKGNVVQLKRVLVNGAKSQSQMNQIVISLSRNLRDGNCQLADILPNDGRDDFKLVTIILEPHDF
jgi:hypothetical protein